MQAETLLASMSPQKRSGKFFLITFNGINISEGTSLRELISTYHIGGFVLRADHDNFSGTDTLPAAYDLIAAMSRRQPGKNQPSPNTSLSGGPAYVPLFIGIEQNGDSDSQLE